jgi:hypothetical protein
MSVTLAAATGEVHRGRVLSMKEPVADATVRLKATNVAVKSRGDGGFELRGQGDRITAWKPGFFIGGANADDSPLRIRLRPLPKEDNPDYAWIDPRPDKAGKHNCANCHAQIFEEWAGSAHGRSGSNRRFLDLYAGTDWNGKADVGWNLLKEHPAGSGVCSACHAPSVPSDDPGLDDFRRIRGVHRQGVHCDYCHKIGEVNVGKHGGRQLGLEHGRFGHQLLRPKEGQLFFGPLDDVDGGEDTFAPLYKESRYCASCHEGTIFGTKVYTTYSEWLESPAGNSGKQCQTCHMTPTGKVDNFAPGKGGVKRDPQTLASHHLPGGDKDMLQRCLSLDVALTRSGDRVVVKVLTRATDVGHRVPTGFIDRQLILLVEALRADGAGVKHTGGPTLPASAGVGEAAAGHFAGLPGKLFARQIVDEQGQTPIPFWRPNRELADTRLFPDRPDTGEWSFPAAEVKQVRVRLIYRRFYHAVATQKRWPDNERLIVDQRHDAP